MKIHDSHPKPSRCGALLRTVSGPRIKFPVLACSLAISWAFPVHAETEVFNTPGTVDWICPPGVTAIQVECWGGGGAGGAGTKAVNTATNTSQNGGGGGGGAYARRIAVPVTPGNTYTFTIPPAATA